MTRSEAIDMLRQICSYLTAGNPVWRTEPIREACDMAIEALTEKESSAEPQRKRRKWNKLSDDTFNCQECGATFVILQGEAQMNYCPNCGAKMGE